MHSTIELFICIFDNALFVQSLQFCVSIDQGCYDGDDGRIFKENSNKFNKSKRVTTPSDSPSHIVKKSGDM